mgnify:CR=1 FL=1
MTNNVNSNPFGLAEAVNSDWENSNNPVPYPKSVKKFLELIDVARLENNSATDPITVREFVRIVRQNDIQLGPHWQDSYDTFKAALEALLPQVTGEVIGEKRKATNPSASPSASTEEPPAKKRKVDEMTGSDGSLSEIDTTIQGVIRQATGLLPPLIELVLDYVPTGKSAYNEVTKRIQNQKAAIEEALSAIPDKRVNDMMEELEKVQWNAEGAPFDNPDFPLIALKALRMGRMTDQQFATSTIFAAAHRKKVLEQQKKRESFFDAKKPSLVKVPLFDTRGQPTEDALAIVRCSVTSSMDTSGSSWQHETGNYMFLDNDKISLFFDLMSKLPASERQFLLMPKLDSPSSIATAIVVSRAFRVFYLLNANALDTIPTAKQFVMDPKSINTVEIIPSAGMMQSFLTAMRGDHAVRMNFVLGASGSADIRQNGLEDTRDVGVPYHPWAPLPNNVEGINAIELTYCYDGFYRSFVASWIPSGHRKLFIDALDMLKGHKLAGQTAEGVRKVCDRLCNMEHTIYLPHRFRRASVYNQLLPQHSPMMFWATLAYIVEQSLLSSEQEKVVVELFVKRYAVEEAGRNKGVTRNDLLELADLLTKKIKEQESTFRMLSNSPIFRMKELYQTL